LQDKTFCSDCKLIITKNEKNKMEPENSPSFCLSLEVLEQDS